MNFMNMASCGMLPVWATPCIRIEQKQRKSDVQCATYRRGGRFSAQGIKPPHAPHHLPMDLKNWSRAAFSSKYLR